MVSVNSPNEAVLIPAVFSEGFKGRKAFIAPALGMQFALDWEQLELVRLYRTFCPAFLALMASLASYKMYGGNPHPFGPRPPQKMQ